ncbi:hypothetical protein DFA_06795 [Cavenderia fasciculata]|uniref:Monalysin Pore-forming domain-containing protein n=1 Tax=Cavenderia fasciculata TaxID=261658 RepID=F4Q2A8_CACFS|nr:uncharacterized protein DFA_06795 [Cavenderia fasciculata]EGG18128.1 hypothetical protein DFA_06795 [Cavenderia fasciculata]|eukprot:XP_004366169.1 hypothetical protein DFA_06795 [Cavenderia fasciculata]
MSTSSTSIQGHIPSSCIPTTKESLPEGRPAFYLDNSIIVDTSYGVDSRLKLMVPADHCVLIDSNYYQSIKPIAVYHKLIKEIPSTSPQSVPITYYKGWVPGSSSFNASTIQACDDQSNVGNLFNYGSSIPSQTTLSKNVDIGIGTFEIYQTILVYGVSPSFSVCSVYRDDLYAINVTNIRTDPNPDSDVISYLTGRGASRWH